MVVAPSHLRLLLSLSALTIALSLSSLLRIPRILPFIDPAVRAAAPTALNELRVRGLWLVNIDLLSIEQSDEKLCFTFTHRYRGAAGSKLPEIITTCTNND